MKTSPLLPALVAASALALAACTQGAAPEQSASPASGPLHVAASFYPLKYLTESIGADLVEVTSLTPDGAEPHDLELSPSAVASLGQIDAVVYLAGFQKAVDDAIAQNSPKTVIDVSQAVQLVSAHDASHDADTHNEDAHEAESDAHEHEAESGTHEHEAESDAHEHEAESGTHDHDEATESDEHAGHHHDMAADPHFWLDPKRMGQAATAIGQALAKADPTNAQTYTANAAVVTKSMDDLSTELVSGTATCEHTTFVTAHAAFGYLADRTGLTQVGISGLDPDSSPSPARLKEISDLVKAEGLTTIFTEALIDPKVEQTLADDLGITTAVLDPIESQVDPEKDYAAVMRENIAALRTALNCK